MYNPDEWVLLKVKYKEGDVSYRVFAGWRGGYTTGDSWKLSSGTVKITKETVWKMSGSYQLLHMTQESGSVYTCFMCGEHAAPRGWRYSTLDSIVKELQDTGATVEFVPWDIDFEAIDLKC